jgi:hypothetical protein
MLTDIEKLTRYLEDHPGAEMHGFLWCGDGDYRCVVLAVGVKPKKSIAAEFVGDTAEDLVKKAFGAGIDIGDAPDVQRRCESAPASLRRGRRK